MAAVPEIYHRTPLRWAFVWGGPIPQPKWSGWTRGAVLKVGTTLGMGPAMGPGWVRRELETSHLPPDRLTSSEESGGGAAWQRTHTVPPTRSKSGGHGLTGSTTRQGGAIRDGNDGGGHFNIIGSWPKASTGSKELRKGTRRWFEGQF